MSTRTYNLQMHAGSGLATQNSQEQITACSHIPATHKVTPHVPEAQPRINATVNTWLYSDVVALRPPSPQEVKETTSLPAGDPSLEKPSHVLKTEPAAQKADNNSSNKSLSDKLSGSPKGQEHSGWTTVERRCAHSLSSLYQVPVKKNSTTKTSIATSLTAEQQQTVKTATSALSQQQKQQIQLRQEKITAHQGSTLSWGEGLSQAKGKAIDPQEWGNVQLNTEEMSVEA